MTIPTPPSAPRTKMFGTVVFPPYSKVANFDFSGADSVEFGDGSSVVNCIMPGVRHQEGMEEGEGLSAGVSGLIFTPDDARRIEYDPQQSGYMPSDDVPKEDLGLYAKFIVNRTDGKSAKGEKHYRCDYFVLDLTHDRHALKALTAYLLSLHDTGTYQKLQLDLLAKINDMAARERTEAGVELIEPMRLEHFDRLDIDDED